MMEISPYTYIKKSSNVTNFPEIIHIQFSIHIEIFIKLYGSSIQSSETYLFGVVKQFLPNQKLIRHGVAKSSSTWAKMLLQTVYSQSKCKKAVNCIRDRRILYKTKFFKWFMICARTRTTSAVKYLEMDKIF